MFTELILKLCTWCTIQLQNKYMYGPEISIFVTKFFICGFLCFNMRWYAFCMVFHERRIFLTTSLRIPPESRSDEGGIRRRVFSHTLHCKAPNQAKYNVQSCRSWKPCEMDLSHKSQLFSTWGKVRSMRETKLYHHYYKGPAAFWVYYSVHWN